MGRRAWFLVLAVLLGVSGAGYIGVAQSGAPGPGWVQTPGGGWVPPDHPLAQPTATPSPAGYVCNDCTSQGVWDYLRKWLLTAA